MLHLYIFSQEVWLTLQGRHCEQCAVVSGSSYTLLRLLVSLSERDTGMVLCVFSPLSEPHAESA